MVNSGLFHCLFGGYILVIRIKTSGEKEEVQTGVVMGGFITGPRFELGLGDA